MTTIHKRIYRKLERLGVLGLVQAKVEASKSESQGFMALHFDALHIEPSGAVVVALAHYFAQNGDQCADPDMEIRIRPVLKMAEALTFQQAIPPIYQQVYPEPGLVNLRLKRQLNQFLNMWLKNCIEQGHSFRLAEVVKAS